MSFVHSILAMLSVFVAPLSGWAAFSLYRKAETRMAVTAGLVCCAAAVLWLTAPKNDTIYSDNCFIDWDARSNATVCD